jgi:hypothetical protein
VRLLAHWLKRWPLRRFGVAMQRSFTEDRLVALAIALEAIFIREDDPQRGTRGFIAERANRLLDGDRSVGKLRSNGILDVYNIRSDIVHGRLPSEDDVERASAKYGNRDARGIAGHRCRNHSARPRGADNPQPAWHRLTEPLVMAGQRLPFGLLWISANLQ